MVDKSKMTREELFFFEIKEMGIELPKPEPVKEEKKAEKKKEK